MTKKRFSAVGFIAAVAIAVSGLVVPSASAADEIVVWADESRGANLKKALAVKSDWVAGYTITVKSFSNFDALKELRERQPDRVLETNVEFWAAIILDFAEVPAPLFTSMFTAARTAGWSAHILEQKRTGRLIRPSARYVGKAPRKPEDVTGWDATVEQLHK